MLDSGWIAAISSATSALVVVATAFVSIRQLKHYRNANDIVVYLRLIEEMDSPENVAARDQLREWNERLADPELRDRLTKRGLLGEQSGFVSLVRFLEHFAVLVERGSIAEELVLAEYADTFVEIWDQIRETIFLRRQVYGPFMAAAFEHLAMRSRKYLEGGRMKREYARLLHDERPSIYGTPRS
jgi:hypothetical protein